MELIEMKGQVEAPIELVVAVIILIASMAIAFNIMNQSGEEQCITKLKTQLTRLAEDLVDVQQGSPPTSKSVPFTLYSCGSIAVDGIRFAYYQNPAYCGLCRTGFGGCWVIEPLQKDPQTLQHRPVERTSVCVDMPGAVVINPVCQDLSSSERLVDYQKPCPDGTGPSGENEIIDGKCPGVPENIWKESADNPSFWNTFIRESGGAQTYVIELTKAGGAGGAQCSIEGQDPLQGMECPQINICIRIPYATTTP
jgi:hypothetical protein